MTNFTSPQTADSRCNGDGAKPNASSYKAVMAGPGSRLASATPSAGDGQIDWVLWPSTPYVQSDGVTSIATTTAQRLFVFPLTNATSAGPALYFTALNADWTINANHCSAWASNSVGLNAMRGTSSGADTSSGAISSSTMTCDITQQLLCAEQ